MGTTMEDILNEEIVSILHHEAMMKRAALEQCIYIFVEGDSEEATFQMLLESCGLDFQEYGIVIANYNGIGNLKHAVRLLQKTLSHDRPIIVTYDDDLDGKRISKFLNYPLITGFKVPITPVVTYRDGSSGGSFEEAFSPKCFLHACFQDDVLQPSFPDMPASFLSMFDERKPWFQQLERFVKNNGVKARINKVRLAECMAESCNPVPYSGPRFLDSGLRC